MQLVHMFSPFINGPLTVISLNAELDFLLCHENALMHTSTSRISSSWHERTRYEKDAEYVFDLVGSDCGRTLLVKRLLNHVNTPVSVIIVANVVELLRFCVVLLHLECENNENAYNDNLAHNQSHAL